MKELIFEPLGLHNTWFFPNDIMTRRFAVGHNKQHDGTIKVARPWALPRGGWPAGGMSANAADQIAWAKFHLGDGTGVDGSVVLSEKTLKRMQEPTVDTPGSALGDHIGISWMLRDLEGVRVVGHGGDTIGQHSEFVTVPERNFALISMTNCGPNGSEFNEDLFKWAFEHYLSIVVKDPEPITLGEAELAKYAGRYETIAVWLDVTVEGSGLLAKIDLKPEMAKVLQESGEEIPEDEPAFPLGILEGEGDKYIVTSGPAKGMKGYFARNERGEIEAVHMGGRLATRVKETASVS